MQLVQRVTHNRDDASALAEIELLQEILSQHKASIEEKHSVNRNTLCASFLRDLLHSKEAEMRVLELQTELLRNDLTHLQGDASTSANSEDLDGFASKRPRRTSAGMNRSRTGSNDSRVPAESSQLAARKWRVDAQFADWRDYYFDLHCANPQSTPGQIVDVFKTRLSVLTTHSRFNLIGRVNGHGIVAAQQGFISSIEFSRNKQYFATAGMMKKIKIFEYQTVIENPRVEFHVPTRDVTGSSRISCLSWNPFITDQLASCDYDGCVRIWDAFLGRELFTFKEHDKRAWSIDFSPIKPALIASGADDGKVKVWDLSQSKSVHTLDTQSNVCCVRFSPTNENILAFGSSDHNMYVHDLRRMKEPVLRCKSHAKAISYIRFVNTNEIITASTDSTLKLWNIASEPQCKRTYKGHTNERNFVGLSVNDEYIACGSESDSIYVYAYPLSKPIIIHPFHEALGEQKGSVFITTVCWKDSQTLVGANTTGRIQVLKLSSDVPKEATAADD